MSDAEKYIVVKQLILEDEDRLQYLAMEFFEKITDAEEYAIRCECDPGDVVYVCDTAEISSLPESAIFIFACPDDRILSPLNTKRSAYLIDWLDTESTADVLMEVAVESGVESALLNKAVCECLRSMLPLKDGNEEIDALISLCEDEYARKPRREVYEAASDVFYKYTTRRVSNLYIGASASASCANSIMYLTQDEFCYAIGQIIYLNEDFGAIIRSVVSTKTFIRALASS